MKVSDILEEYKELPSHENLEVLTLTEKNGFVPQVDRFHKRLATQDTSKYRVVNTGDFAYNPYLLWAGAIAVNERPDPGIISPVYPTFRLKEGFDPGYIFALLLSPLMLKRYDTISYGSVPRRRRAATKDFLNLTVPDIPPLEEQQRIATILGTVEEAIRAEEQSISKLETLVKNLAPETNRTVPIGEYVERIVSGKSLKEHSTPGGPRVLKISSTTSGYFKPEESKPLDPSYEPPEHHRVQEGDLLVSRANTTELVGASAIVDQPYENLLLPDKLWRLVTKDSVDPFFLWACLQHPLTRNAISKASSGSGGSMKNISQTNFLSVEIPDVDAALQTTVGNQVRTAFHQRALRSSKLTLLRELYTSLSSRAFSREL